MPSLIHHKDLTIKTVLLAEFEISEPFVNFGEEFLS